MSVTYSYPKPPGTSLGVLAINLEKAGLPMPDGINTDETQAGIIYSVALTVPQKVLLDATMAAPGIGEIPTTANTIYDWRDPTDFRVLLNSALAASGFSFTPYPFGFGTSRMLFSKTLTNPNKNALQAAVFANLITIVQP